MRRQPAHASGEIQVLVPHIRRLFNPMDPSPMRQKDLDPDVEEFIVSWGRELPRRFAPSLTVRVEEGADVADTAEVAAAIHAFFAQRADVNARRLRQLFRIGRASLAIAIVVLGASIAAGELLVWVSVDSGIGRAIGGTLEIGGWVAMWRPLSIFLYDWWPIAADIRLLRRLAEMPVQVVSQAGRPLPRGAAG